MDPADPEHALASEPPVDFEPAASNEEGESQENVADISLNSPPFVRHGGFKVYSWLRRWSSSGSAGSNQLAVQLVHNNDDKKPVPADCPGQRQHERLSGVSPAVASKVRQWPSRKRTTFLKRNNVGHFFPAVDANMSVSSGSARRLQLFSLLYERGYIHARVLGCRIDGRVQNEIK